MTAQLKQRPDPAVVLSKALLNASKQLTLKQDELGKVIGVHRTAITRLKQNLDLSPDSKQGELALLLIRAARALFARKIALPLFRPRQAVARYEAKLTS